LTKEQIMIKKKRLYRAAFFMTFTLHYAQDITFSEFKQSLQDQHPTGQFSVHLQALWWGGKGDWHRAHDLVQDGQDAGTSWIHAWLHRVEGDEGNASYWYARAGKQKPNLSLDAEWELLATHFLSLKP
jgi:hypothetical protein